MCVFLAEFGVIFMFSSEMLIKRGGYNDLMVSFLDSGWSGPGLSPGWG